MQLRKLENENLAISKIEVVNKFLKPYLTTPNHEG